MSSAGGAGLTGMTETPTSTTHTVGVGDDLITYDVRGDLSSGTPLFMFASPMDASGFGSLASQFTDRPVVTYDPRGTGRNARGTTDLDPGVHADDLHRVVEALGVGPVDAFGSSGGGVNLLALCAARPDDVRVAVVHEPATFVGLPDSAVVLAAVDDIKATYAASGNGPAMAKFIQLVMRTEELPADYLDLPVPDPGMFGQPSEDDGSRDNALIRNMPACTAYEVDVDALAALGDRVVVAVGVASADGAAARGGRAVAARLGLPVSDFPGDHGSFFDSEYAEAAGVAEAAQRLRELLAR
jgi:pimeloyl-ACP methyl ester carboxylesterase